MQRLFFGLWPDDAARQALRVLQQERGPASGRKVHPEDLHLTLAFLGPVAEDRLACLEAAAELVSAEPFELVLTRLGHWRGPRVAWAAPEQTPPDLASLVDQLWQGLVECGFEREARPFSAHVTLARKVRPFRTLPLADPIVWEAREFVLVTSLSVPEPPRYKVLRRWPLQKAENQG
jgi:2'-5' RNA ligase